jgi:hypothetical protein
MSNTVDGCSSTVDDIGDAIQSIRTTVDGSGIIDCRSVVYRLQSVSKQIAAYYADMNAANASNVSKRLETIILLEFANLIYTTISDLIMKAHMLKANAIQLAANTSLSNIDWVTHHSPKLIEAVNVIVMQLHHMVAFYAESGHPM